MKILLTSIRCDAGTQIRVSTSESTVLEYTERMMAGDVFPPVDVFIDGKDNYLADGFHRLLAAGRAGRTDIECNVHNGTLSDAIWFAVGANRTNGLSRTLGDKHAAISLALRTFPGKTQQAIADHVGCSRQYVDKVQDELATSCKLTPPPSRVGKDGKVRPTTYKRRKKKPGYTGDKTKPQEQAAEPSPPCTPAYETIEEGDAPIAVATASATPIEQAKDAFTKYVLPLTETCSITDAQAFCNWVRDQVG
jgi:hypothetical protein